MASHFLEFTSPFKTSTGVDVSKLHFIPPLSGYTTVEYPGLMALHPDIRAHVYTALMDIADENEEFETKVSTDGTSPFGQYGLAFSIAPTTPEKDQRIRELLVASGFTTLANGSFAISNDPNEAELLAQFPSVQVGPHTFPEHKWPVIPGGLLWSAADSTAAENVATGLAQKNIAIAFDANFQPVIGTEATAPAAADASVAATTEPAAAATAADVTETATDTTTSVAPAGSLAPGYLAFPKPYEVDPTLIQDALTDELTVEGIDIAAPFAFSPTDEQATQIANVHGETIYGALDGLHPDIRTRATSALLSLAEKNIVVNIENLTTTDPISLENQRLAFRVTASNSTEQDEIDAAFRDAGFFGGAEGRWAYTDDDNAAYAIAAMPTHSVESVFGGSFDYAVLPNGQLWSELARDLPDVINGFSQSLQDNFGLTVSASSAPALQYPAAPETPAETSTETTYAPPRLFGNKEQPTSVPFGLDKWTYNGLAGLGVIREGMTDDDAKAAIQSYIEGTGRVGTYSATELKAQVRTDVAAWQTYVLSQDPANGGQYDLGPFGPKKDGVDGLFGDYTFGATTSLMTDHGTVDPLAIIRDTALMQQAASIAAEKAAVAKPAATVETAAATAPAETPAASTGSNYRPTQLDAATAFGLQEALIQAGEKWDALPSGGKAIEYADDFILDSIRSNGLLQKAGTSEIAARYFEKVIADKDPKSVAMFLNTFAGEMTQQDFRNAFLNNPSMQQLNDMGALMKFKTFGEKMKAANDQYMGGVDYLTDFLKQVNSDPSLTAGITVNPQRLTGNDLTLVTNGYNLLGEATALDPNIKKMYDLIAPPASRQTAALDPALDAAITKANQQGVGFETQYDVASNESYIPKTQVSQVALG